MSAVVGGEGCVNKYVASLDVGSTTIRCHIYNDLAKIVGSSSKKIELIQSHQGWFELDEELIFMQAVHVIREALANAKLSSSSLDCLGITTQRNTFITWDKDSGEPFHHLVTWQDLRACKYVDRWNSCFKMKLFKGVFKFLHLFTRSQRFLAASKLEFKSAQVVSRLKWMLDNNSRLKERVDEQKVLFGTLDTWLLWKLTGKKMFATDYSNASSTAMFDPFQMSWSGVICKLVGIPMHILPPILDTSGYFGSCDSELFGAKIPIRALVADQQSSMFGHCCFDPGDVKCTLGTGTFVDYNSGGSPHCSTLGFYPLVGWKIGSECVYIAEGFASSTGQSFEWAQSIGLFNKVEETEEMALKSLACHPEPLDLCFVPAFNGFQAPVNDDRAATLMIGMTLGTTKEDVVRSILNSVAFRFNLIHTSLLEEVKGKELSDTILCDGGVSNNTYLLQTMSQLTNKNIMRPKNADATSLGAAYLAGLSSGVWNGKKQFVRMKGDFEKFRSLPQECGSDVGRGGDVNDNDVDDAEKREVSKSGRGCKFSSVDDISTEYNKWLGAVERCKRWQSY